MTSEFLNTVNADLDEAITAYRTDRQANPEASDDEFVQQLGLTLTHTSREAALTLAIAMHRLATMQECEEQGWERTTALTIIPLEWDKELPKILEILSPVISHPDDEKTVRSWTHAKLSPFMAYKIENRRTADGKAAYTLTIQGEYLPERDGTFLHTEIVEDEAS